MFQHIVIHTPRTPNIPTSLTLLHCCLPNFPQQHLPIWPSNLLHWNLHPRLLVSKLPINRPLLYWRPEISWPLQPLRPQHQVCRKALQPGCPISSIVLTRYIIPLHWSIKADKIIHLLHIIISFTNSISKKFSKKSFVPLPTGKNSLGIPKKHDSPRWIIYEGMHNSQDNPSGQCGPLQLHSGCRSTQHGCNPGLAHYQSHPNLASVQLPPCIGSYSKSWISSIPVAD